LLPQTAERTIHYYPDPAAAGGGTYTFSGLLPDKFNNFHAFNLLFLTHFAFRKKIVFYYFLQGKF